MRVAAGAIARKILPGMNVRGALVQMGPHKIDRDNWDWDEIARNPFFCPDKDKAAFFESYLDGIRKSGSSIGAVIEVVAEGVPAGLGAPIYAKLDAELAAALMSINAVKGVEIGAGFGAAELSGEENADEMRMGNQGVSFLSNHAGGISGWHLHRAAGGGAVCGEADIVHPLAAPHRRSQRRRHRNRHQRPPRPLRRHPRRAGRRSHDGLRAGRSFPAASRTGREVADVSIRNTVMGPFLPWSRGAQMNSAVLQKIMDWLIDGSRSSASPTDMMAELCELLVDAGLPLWRVALFVRTLHPDIFGRAFLLAAGGGGRRKCGGLRCSGFAGIQEQSARDPLCNGRGEFDIASTIPTAIDSRFSTICVRRA